MGGGGGAESEQKGWEKREGGAEMTGEDKEGKEQNEVDALWKVYKKAVVKKNWLMYLRSTSQSGNESHKISR